VLKIRKKSLEFVLYHAAMIFSLTERNPIKHLS
jgi:hypothetical protein